MQRCVVGSVRLAMSLRHPAHRNGASVSSGSRQHKQVGANIPRNPATIAPRHVVGVAGAGAGVRVGSMRIAVVIVSLNGAKRLPACLAPLRASVEKYRDTVPGGDVEVWVADNGSPDATTLSTLAADPLVRVVRAPRNLGFAGGNNLAVRRASGDMVILLNDDTYPDADWLIALRDAALAKPDYGALGCLLLYPKDRTVQHAGGQLDANGLTHHLGWGDPESAWRDKPMFECPYVTGAALAMSRSALDAVGTLDPGFFPIYYEETEWCLRVRLAGFGVWMVPNSVVLHDESQVTQVRSKNFYRMFHRHRYRFLFKTRTRAQLGETIRAEWNWIKHRPHWNHVPPVMRAIWALMTTWRTWLRSRRAFWAQVRAGRKAVD